MFFFQILYSKYLNTSQLIDFMELITSLIKCNQWSTSPLHTGLNYVNGQII